jgi:DNA-binding beta-propeller fold protein YncE
MNATFGSLRSVRAVTPGAILACVLCACSGSPSTQAVPLAPRVPSSSPSQAAAGKTATRVVITIPAHAAARAKTRRPSYVSPSTQSITVQVDDATPTVQNLSPTAPDCSGAGANYPYTCTVPIAASPGSHTFTFVTYDGSSAAGNELSANSIVQTIDAGQNNAIAVTLAGVPVAVQVDPAVGQSGITGDQTGLTFVGRLTQKLMIVTVDADGNDIVGPGAPALAVSVNGPSAGSGIAIASSTTSANQFLLSSSDPGTATLTIAATPASTLAGATIDASVPLAALADTTTLAGTPSTSGGFADGTGSAAMFNGPSGVAFDPANGDAYVSDGGNCAIRQITSAGIVTTIAGGGPSACGNADGSGSAALFGAPAEIAYDSANGDLYVADFANCDIRQVTPSGTVTTLAGSGPSKCTVVNGTGASAGFDNPEGVAYDPTSGNLYVTDFDGCTVRMVTTAGVVTTLAGGTCGDADGTGTAAEFSSPAGLAYDPNDGNLYLADNGNCSIRKVTTAGVVTTVAGGGPNACDFADGTGTAALFEDVSSVAYSAIDGNLYVTDPDNRLVRQVTTAGVVKTIAGAVPVPSSGYADGLGDAASFSDPAGIAYDSANGSLFVTDAVNSTIRVVEP